ncbi:MAG: FadR family transcriptional regulator [Clostridiaceae bacterium]|nr:FadR family transcriptional regulator [Clostridiaceae bacterium]
MAIMTDKKAYENVISYTKNEILSGTLKQGQKLPPERELAEKLGVGRTSVREALRVMEILGLIESIQGAGNYITGNFGKSITEALSMMFLLQKTGGQKLNEVRACLELKAAELAIDNITDEETKSLEEILEKMEYARNEGEEASLDKQLHYEIASASGNTVLLQMLSSISVLVEDFIKDIRKSILSEEKNRTRLKQIHRDIVEAIINKDKTALRSGLKRHSNIIDENLC